MARSPNSPSSSKPDINSPRYGGGGSQFGTTTGDVIGLQQDQGPEPIGVDPSFKYLPAEQQKEQEEIRQREAAAPDIPTLTGDILTQRNVQRDREIASRAQPPRYMKGLHDTRIFEMSREQVADIQRDLASAGLLTGDFKLGRAVPGDNTHRAWETLLGYSNATGQTWQEATSDLMTSETVTTDEEGNIVPREQADQQEPGQFVRGKFIPRDFTPDAFLQPDHAELTQRIRQQFENVLGRPPSQREIGHYVSGLSDAAREAYEANVAASREEFEATESARERQFLRQDRERERQFYEQEVFGRDASRPDEPGGFAIARPPDERDMPPLEQADAVPDVNPIARFREQFRRDYANTLERQTKLESAEAGRESLMSSILTMDRAIAGGR